MARTQQISYTSGSVSAGSSLQVNTTGLPSIFNIVKIKVTPNTPGATSRFELYKRDTFAAADLAYSTDEFDTGLVDPWEAGSGTERTFGFVVPYEDLDSTGELHAKIYNNDTVSKTYAVVIDYEEGPLFSSTGDVTFRGSTAHLSSATRARVENDSTGPVSLRVNGIDRAGFAEVKALVNNTLTNVCDLTISSNGDVCSGFLLYSIEVNSSGSSVQTATGIIHFMSIRSSGTTSVQVNQLGSEQQLRSSGTLSITWSIATSAPGATIKVTSNSSLGVDHTLRYTLINNSVKGVSPQ